MQTAMTRPSDEEFGEAESAKFQRWLDAREAKRIKSDREKRDLTTEPVLRRNETGVPFPFTSTCTASDELLPKDLRCDGLDPGCRHRRAKPLAAPGELFWENAGHRKRANAALPKVDPASVPDEPTTGDRLVLVELRAAKKGAEGPAAQSARAVADLEAQERIVAQRKLQELEELERRQSHVQAAKAKTEEFLGSRSAAWKEALLGGKAGASLEAAKRAADEAERHRPIIRTTDDLRRSAAGDTEAKCFKSGVHGPEPLPVGRS